MDHTTNFGVSLESLLDNIRTSKLLSETDLQDFLAMHPDKDAIGLTGEFVSSGLLTEYQIEAICQGFPDSLRIGNYDILDKLGEGGMGTVFKARHRKMKRIVALKVLLQKFCEDVSFVKRFQREVETIARLGHPNIVMAYDADESDAGHFLVMEFVDGRDLASTVEKKGPMSVAAAVDCVVQSARGLGYAHSLDIIHRDIKPANLLLDKTGAVKITDLGLARLTADAPARGTGITQAGYVLGTPDYMPPEQAVDSSDLDGRSDIYSLGVTLYFLLTGKLMYTGSSVMAVLLKHRDAPIPRLGDSRDDIPVEVEAPFARMVAKAPEERFQSMAEVIAAFTGMGAATSLTATGQATLQTAQVEALPPPQSLSVAIIEPSRVQAGIIRKYLDAQGISTLAVVGNSSDALAAVRKHHPEAIVCALHLPDISGLDFAKLMRAEHLEQAPGIVFISSEADSRDSGSLSKLERAVLLLKPFTPDQLVEALNLVTGKSIAIRMADASVFGLPGLKPGSSLFLKAKVRKERSAMKVLIVDDSTTCRVHERLILEKVGFKNFSEAADGANAIAAATREPFDLIVTDYNMPLMNGLALVSYLKQTPSTAEVPIVMVTTETADAVLDPLRALGVAAVFDKMFAVEDVKQLMDQLFG